MQLNILLSMSDISTHHTHESRWRQEFKASSSLMTSRRESFQPSALLADQLLPTSFEKYSFFCQAKQCNYSNAFILHIHIQLETIKYYATSTLRLQKERICSMSALVQLLNEMLAYDSFLITIPRSV